MIDVRLMIVLIYQQQCRQEDMLVCIINSLVPSQYALSSDCYGNHVIAKCLDAKPVSIRYPLYNAIIMDAARVMIESDD